MPYESVSVCMVAIEAPTNLRLVHGNSIARSKWNLRPRELAPRLFIPKHVHRAIRENRSDNTVGKANDGPRLVSVRVCKCLDLLLTICGMVATQVSVCTFLLWCLR